MKESTTVEANTALAIRNSLPVSTGEEIQHVLQMGDLAKLTQEERARYYLSACASIGLNPLTRPFTLLKNQQGEIFLFANKLCAEQLRKRDKISVRIVSRERDKELYTVIAQATTPDGREEESIAVVAIKDLTGQQLANQIMRCETKAKNRVTMAICGLGFAADDDADPKAISVSFNPNTGEIAEPRTPRTLSLAAAVSPSGEDAVRENIDALLRAQGVSLEDSLAWWDKMKTEYGGTLSPGTLSMLYDRLQTKAKAKAPMPAPVAERDFVEDAADAEDEAAEVV